MSYTDSAVALMNAANFPVCFVAACAAGVVISVKRAFQRSDDRFRAQKHLEDMERLRLSATKELTVRRDD